MFCSDMHFMHTAKERDRFIYEITLFTLNDQRIIGNDIVNSDIVQFAFS